MRFHISVKLCCIIIELIAAISSLEAQYLENPSFEGPIGERVTPPNWEICKELSTPDTQPGVYSVDLPAFEGDTYLSLVTRGPRIPFNPVENTTEAVQAKLLQPLIPGYCYTMTVYLAFDPKFDNLTDQFDQPIKLNIWGGTDECSFDQFLWESPTIDHTDWISYTFQIKPNSELDWIILDAAYVGNSTYDGSILIDNLTFDRYTLNLVEDQVICTNESIVLEPNIPDLLNVLWNTGETTTSITVNEPGTYWITGDINDCQVSDTITISTLQIDLGEDLTICNNEPITILPNHQNLTNILWSNGETNNSIAIFEPGEYWITAFLDNCFVSDTIIISNEAGCCNLAVPNAFTPNGDNLNDQFVILGRKEEFDFFEIQIFNRWGERVYLSSNFDEFWDGKTNNQTKGSAVFYWIINFSCKSINQDKNPIQSLKGHVTLLR